MALVDMTCFLLGRVSSHNGFVMRVLLVLLLLFTMAMAKAAPLCLAHGASLGQVGVREGNESNPDGPRALAFAGERLYLLDALNRRVQVFDGGRAHGAIPLDDEMAQDLALLKEGRLALLSSFASGEVRILAADGTTVARYPLLRFTERKAGALALRRVSVPGWGGLWVEFGVGTKLYAVRIADERGEPISPRTLPHGLTLDGQAGIDWREEAGSWHLSLFPLDDRDTEQTYRLRVPPRETLLHGAWRGEEGTLWIVFSAASGSWARLVRINREGNLQMTLELPASQRSNEVSHPLAVVGNTLYWLFYDRRGRFCMKRLSLDVKKE